MAILMGLDQHRAQITDRVGRHVDRRGLEGARRAGGPRGACAGSLLGFAARQLEVALEATTGWRFVVEELQRIGAIVHLAEPADTAALHGNKKRAKNDRADARHLRELLMAGGCPSRGSRRLTSSTCARGCVCATRCQSSVASGSSGSSRCSITTAARSAAT